MKRNRIIALALALILLAAALPLPAWAMDTDRMSSILNGQWRGEFHVPTGERLYFGDTAVLNYIRDSKNGDRLYLTLESCELEYISLNKWKVDGDTLTFSFNEKPWTAKVALTYDSDNKLTGTYTQYEKEYPLEMKRVSKKPVDLGQYPQFSYEVEETTYEDWYEALSEYQSYASSGGSIPFTYELGQRAHLEPTLKALKVDARLKDLKTDTQKMMALLDIVCQNFRHVGDSGMPDSWDVNSVIRYANAHGGIECRGLSIILAELCRAYGIPAKSIKCSAADVYSEYCHVVVHAYSREQDSWIMLDPSYRLALKNAEGQYVSLPMLRQALIGGEKLVANASAGHNRLPFYMEFYRAYMTKNMFHFSSATNFAHGTDNTPGNTVYTLTPLGYSYTYAYSRGETPTVDAADFWKPPELPGPQPEHKSTS